MPGEREGLVGMHNCDKATHGMMRPHYNYFFLITGILHYYLYTYFAPVYNYNYHRSRAYKTVKCIITDCGVMFHDVAPSSLARHLTMSCLIT